MFKTNLTKENNMKNITKILFVAITSLSLMLTAKAGELTVNGTAKATYLTTSANKKITVLVFRMN